MLLQLPKLLKLTIIYFQLFFVVSTLTKPVMFRITCTLELKTNAVPKNNVVLKSKYSVKNQKALKYPHYSLKSSKL